MWKNPDFESLCFKSVPVEFPCVPSVLLSYLQVCVCVCVCGCGLSYFGCTIHWSGFCPKFRILELLQGYREETQHTSLPCLSKHSCSSVPMSTLSVWTPLARTALAKQTVQISTAIVACLCWTLHYRPFWAETSLWWELPPSVSVTDLTDASVF